jgi:uncharacterized protein YbaA (DUF1428 family)
MNYVDDFLTPVTAAKKEACCAVASKSSALLKEFGATHVVENCGNDVPDGKVTDSTRAVKADGNENVVNSGIGWPLKMRRASRSTANLATTKARYEKNHHHQQWSLSD